MPELRGEREGGGGGGEKSPREWAFTWIMNPEEYLKTHKKELYIRTLYQTWKRCQNNDTEKGSRKMCLILIEGTFIIVLRNKRRFGKLSHL